MTTIRKHRAPDRVRQLETENADLRRELAAHEDAAGRLNESILRGIQDATALVEAQDTIDRQQRHAARVIVQHHCEMQELQQQLDTLRAERVDASVLTKQLGAAEAHIKQIASENLALRANIANRDAITVPPMHRDIDPTDQATTPTDVTRLRRSYKVQTLADAMGGAA